MQVEGEWRGNLVGSQGLQTELISEEGEYGTVFILLYVCLH